MTRARVAAAAAGIVTVLLLQATLVGPLTTSTSWPLAVSLPAVLVGAVASVDGVGTGLAFGFATGLVADLASRHPAGLLALCWLGVGLVCGAAADRHRLRRDATTVGAVAAVAGAIATVLLTLVGDGGRLRDAVLSLVPTALVDALLAVVVVAVVRRMLASEYLRAPAALPPTLVPAVPRGR